MSANSLAHLESRFLIKSSDNKSSPQDKLCFLSDEKFIIRIDENSPPEYEIDLSIIDDVTDTSDGSTFSFAIRFTEINESSPTSINQNEFETEETSQIPTLFSNNKNQTVFSFAAPDLTTFRKWITTLRTNLSENKIGNSNLINSHANLSLNDFQFLSSIGRGFSGEVLLCRYVPTGKLVALKSIPKEGIQRSNCIKHAFAERNILMQASTPFITRLLSTFQTGNSFYFVLEFVQGGDLAKQILHKRTFSQYQIQLYLAEIALALSHLHKLGIVFRDLKPANILIDSKGHLKLTDFGLAKYLLVEDHTTSMCGTHEYLAPEMIKGASYSFAVDWWAYGVVAYQLLQGVLPFESQNLNKLYERIVKSSLRFWKPIPENAKSLIQGLLKKSPEKRLGCGENGEGEIFDHPYFSGIDWDRVKNKEYQMEFIPEISRDLLIEDCECHKSSIDEDGCYIQSCSANESHIAGFSYAGQGLNSPNSEIGAVVF